MNPIHLIGAASLAACLGAFTCRAQGGSPPAQDSRDAETVAGFACPGREPDRPRPEVRLRLGDITCKARALPRPTAPRVMVAARLPYPVRAEVVVRVETGEVVWARVLNGHPALRSAVGEVVCRARFYPMHGRFNASGVISYRFRRRG